MDDEHLIMLSEVTVQQCDSTMTSVHPVATVGPNNDFGSHCCNQEARRTGVSKPGDLGIGERLVAQSP